MALTHIAGGAAIALITAVALLVAFQAQGAPAQPGVQLNGQLNPQVAQSVQITLTSSLYGFVPSNSIFQLGGYFVYTVSVLEGSTNTVLASKLTTAFNVLSANGFQDQVASTISVSVPALCTSGACGGYAENLTVSAYAAVKTYPAFWSSSQVTVSFSNIGNAVVDQGAFAGQAVTTTAVSAGTPNPNGFYAQFYEVLVLMIGLDLLIGGFVLLKMNPYVIGAGGVLVVAAGILAGVWGVP
jgi:hypothetical protein